VDERRLQQAWQNRLKARPARAIGDLVHRAVPQAAPEQLHRLVALGDMWERVLPRRLSADAWVGGVSGGAVRIAVRSAGSQFEVERTVAPKFLRMIQQAYPQWRITRVVVTLAKEAGG